MSDEYPRTEQEFDSMFADEAACRRYVESLRWPKGFVCPACRGTTASRTARGLWLCSNCRRHTSVTAGTLFQDSHVSLKVWFRAMWHVTGQKNGVSALGLKRVLGLGSYRTAWMLLHKLRRAMVRSGRERLSGRVEVDETYWGGPEPGVAGRKLVNKALIAMAVEQRGHALGRVRMRRLPTAGRDQLHRFIREVVEPGSTVLTDGWIHYRGLTGYTHEAHVQKPAGVKGEAAVKAAHRVASLLKRWLLGTHQAAMEHDYLDAYLDEFTFRFNRRTSTHRGKLFWRLAQQAVQTAPVPLAEVRNHKPLGAVE